MHLTHLRITNHSRLKDVDIEIRKHLVLVGPNDVGKSSLLRCLDLLLGASTAQVYARLGSEDFRDADQPLVIEAVLEGFEAHDRALFPDEITVDTATHQESLTLRIEATVDTSKTISIDRRAPGGGTNRQVSREQLEGIGWRSLSATAVSRDLREDRRTALDDILQSVDLGAEKAGFDTLVVQLREKLKASTVLDGLRGDLASQLSKALPEQLVKDDLHFVPGATADDDVLSDVRLQVSKHGTPRNLVEQSDGMRALYAIALYDLVSVGANMVGIDEPEVHLHPTSQRSLARLLQDGPNQKFLATHSADIVSAFTPDCIVSVRTGGVVVQPDANFLTPQEKMSVHWWVRDKLEPLTARRVLAVEGVSDRILVQRVSDLTDRNLDRLGVSVVETDGSGGMGAIVKLFGKAGFDIPMSLLIDEDARQATADKLGVAPQDLEQHSTFVSAPDLEGEYVTALGADPAWTAISTVGLFSPNELANCSASGPGGTRTADDVAEFCRRKGYKVRAAMAIAPVLTDVTGPAIVSINNLLGEIS